MCDLDPSTNSRTYLVLFSVSRGEGTNKTDGKRKHEEQRGEAQDGVSISGDADVTVMPANKDSFPPGTSIL
jgi:hypothetical protein